MIFGGYPSLQKKHTRSTIRGGGYKGKISPHYNHVYELFKPSFLGLKNIKHSNINIYTDTGKFLKKITHDSCFLK